MECPNGCAAPMKVIHVDRIVYRSDEPLVIGNLEIYVCPECGFESMGKSICVMPVESSN